MDLIIKPLTEDHWPEVKKIYEDGIATGMATFETEAPSWKEWDSSHTSHSRFVALSGPSILGWVALSPVSDRCVYGGVAEVSVYIDPLHHGKGVGNKLLTEVIISSERNGIWTLTAAMFPENTGSIVLHEKRGFRKIGYREKIGKWKGEWKDTLIFERRSSVIL